MPWVGCWICRAGVSAIGGRHVCSAPLAQTSTLYWAYRRKYRPYVDLSHGWGSNSQWRTSFRRDYRIDGHLYYNVDGEHDLSLHKLTGPCSGSGNETDSLTRQERLELLIHRCFITTDKPGSALWPYDDKVVLRAETGP